MTLHYDPPKVESYRVRVYREVEIEQETVLGVRATSPMEALEMARKAAEELTMDQWSLDGATVLSSGVTHVKIEDGADG